MTPFQFEFGDVVPHTTRKLVESASDEATLATILVDSGLACHKADAEDWIDTAWDFARVNNR